MTTFLTLLLRRFALLVALLALVFTVVSVLPGDAARAALDRGASSAMIAAKRHELGLDRPLPQRFWSWLSGVPTGDFGTTVRGRPVGELLAAAAPQTLLLGGLALIVTVVAALGLGMWWAARPSGRLARVLQPTTAMVVALPEFVVAAMLIMVFSFAIGWLPAVTVAGRSGFPARPDMLVLPVLALAIPHIGWNTRVVRGALADAGRAPHVEQAALEGLSRRAVLLRHMLPVALPTVVASVATTVGMLFGGALVVESLFNYPGLGALLAGSIGDRDTALTAATAAVAGVVIMGMLICADGIRAWAVRGRR
ncbi:ABC transporter permease [Nocardia sp. NPDC051570]|uniref:ABC transporter permease n=1 Tax=Nocardia sp. NPDC051570 TaxID=3364324 RepID=UPI00379DE2DC